MTAILHILGFAALGIAGLFVAIVAIFIVGVCIAFASSENPFE